MSRQGKSTTPTTSLILLFLLICVMLLKASTASQEESGQEMACTDCIQSSKVWCALTNQCVFTSSECNYKHNVTWFSLPSKTNVKNIPTHCVTGIFTSLDQCPSTQILKVTVQRSGSLSENLKYPLGRQPRILFDTNVTRNAKNLVAGNYFIEGGDVKYSATPYFFSFNYHVDKQLPVVFDMEEGRIKYMDLSVASEPLMYYQIGYGLILPSNITEETFQCTFVPDYTKIWQKADYQWIWKGPHLYLGFPLILVALGLISALMFFCVDRFSVKRHYSGDEDEQEEHSSKRVFLPGYSKTGRYTVIEILRSLFFASDSDIITQCGTDAYYYLWFHKYTMLYLGAMMLVSIPVLLPTYFSAEDFAISFKDFAGFTIASVDLRNSSRIYLIYGVIILFAVFGCAYLVLLRNLARIIVKSNKNFGSLFTVMVSNVSTKLRNRKHLIQDFQNRYGDCVVDAHICYNLRELTQLDKQKERNQGLVEYYQEIYDRTGKRPTIRTGFLWSSTSDALYYYGNEVNQIQAKIDQKEQSGKIYGSGYALVTFNSIAAAQNCINDHVFRCWGFSMPLWCLDNRWDYQVTAAPEADDIIYDNLSYSKAARWIRSIVTNSIMTLILVVVYLVVFCASFLWFYNSSNASKIWDIVSIFGPLAFVIQVLVELTPEIISAITETVKPVLEVLTDWEKHRSRFDFRQSIIRKTAFFMFIAIIIMPYFSIYINGVWKVWYRAMAPFNNYIFYFNYMGVEMITICIVLSTIAKSIELTVALVRMLYQLFKYRKMDRLEFEYDASYGFKISMLVLALIWGALTPLCLPFVFFFFVFTYWIDKYLIMFFFEKGHELDGRVVNTVADVTSYYLNAYPIYIMFILPTLFAVWKTWLILMPFLVVLFFALRALDRHAKAKEIEKIVMGIKEAASDNTEDTMSPEDPDSNGMMSSDPLNNLEDEEENYAPVRTRSPNTPSFASSIIGTIKSKSMGPESRLTTEEIENLVTQHQIAKMANRYKHPYLRKQASLQKHDIGEQF